MAPTARGFGYQLLRGPGPWLGQDTVQPTLEAQAPLTAVVTSLVTSAAPADLHRLARFGVAYVSAATRRHQAGRRPRQSQRRHRRRRHAARSPRLAAAGHRHRLGAPGRCLDPLDGPPLAAGGPGTRRGRGGRASRTEQEVPSVTLSSTGPRRRAEKAQRRGSASGLLPALLVVALAVAAVLLFRPADTVEPVPGVGSTSGPR